MREMSVARFSGRRLRPTLAGVLTLAGLIALAACDGATEPAEQAEAPDLPADMVIEGIDYTITLQGVREAVLVADSGYVHEDSAAIDLVDVDLRVYEASTGGEKAHIVSETGVLNTRTQAMIARGSVRVRLADGAVITTEELHYRPEEDRIWSDVATTIVRASGTVVRGTGFTSDAEFRNYQIRGARTEGGVRF